jgi:hypothetical protein
VIAAQAFGFPAITEALRELRYGDTVPSLKN